MSKEIPADTLKKTIAYFYLLSYCPPESVVDFRITTAPMRAGLAKQAGMKETAYFREILPDVCNRIVAYHEGTRVPSQHWVVPLIEAADQADKSPEGALNFQEQMTKVVRLPQRAKPENRLHRKKGCQFCCMPCHYGYFTLVSDPSFDVLQKMLETEANRSRETQSAIRPVWGFVLSHLQQITGVDQGYIRQAHLGNLSYCLLMLAMAKSRLALPEKQLKVFQAINQQIIQVN